METKKQKSQFGIKTHAQLQTIDGIKYEFQPEHLFCDKCWEQVDTAFAHASHYGSCSAMASQEPFGEKNDCSIWVTKLNK